MQKYRFKSDKDLAYEKFFCQIEKGLYSLTIPAFVIILKMMSFFLINSFSI
jgi:hypothetical protein